MPNTVRQIALLLAAALAGCGSQATPTTTPQPLAINLSASATEFVPDLLAAARHTAVRVRFLNGSTEPHTLIFPAPISVTGGELVDTGQTVIVEFTTPAAGNYPFLCNVHEGMTGILRVN